MIIPDFYRGLAPTSKTAEAQPEQEARLCSSPMSRKKKRVELLKMEILQL